MAPLLVQRMITVEEFEPGVGNLVIEPLPGGDLKAKTAFILYRSHHETDENIFAGAQFWIRSGECYARIGRLESARIVQVDGLH